MPGFWKEKLPVTVDQGGFLQRATELGGMTVSFEHIPKGDYASYFKDLPEGRCHSPHWGYVFKGKVRLRYADHEEIIEAGQVYYIPPGHVPEVLEDADVVEFSNPTAYKQTIETATKAMSSQPASR